MNQTEELFGGFEEGGKICRRGEFKAERHNIGKKSNELRNMCQI